MVCVFGAADLRVEDLRSEDAGGSDRRGDELIHGCIDDNAVGKAPNAIRYTVECSSACARLSSGAGARGRRWYARGHSFDIARSGYINLLQPQERRARRPGDATDAVERAGACMTAG
jgi:hypothetical protein